MKRLFIICMLLQAAFMGATSRCPATCQLDEIAGTWYLFLDAGAAGTLSGLLVIFPDGIMRFAESYTPNPTFDFPNTGSGAYGPWRKLSDGVYQAVTAERISELRPFGECCAPEGLATFKNTWLLTVNPNDKNRLNVEVRIGVYDFDVLCPEGAPNQCFAGIPGEACRLTFDNCPTGPGVFAGCASCLSQAIRTKYCSSCIDSMTCPPTPNV